MSLLTRLIQQAKKPKGIVGSIMLGIMNSAHSGLNKWAFDHVKIKNGDVMLDIGTGGGNTIYFLSKMNKNGKLYGIDYSEQAVKDTIKKNLADVDAGKVVICQASVSELPFTNDYFDFITAFQTHYFWPDLENDLKEVFRILKENGTFMIVSEIYKINYHMTSYKTKDEMSGLFSKVGFRSLRFYEDPERKWILMIGVK